MLFTVNVETISQPFPTLLHQLAPGYGVKSSFFTLNKGKINYQNQLPEESETGLEIIPGKETFDVILKFFPTCVHIEKVKESKMLGYKNFNWPGHVYANSPVYVEYTVVKVKQLTSCVDVVWLCELKDQAGNTACRLNIKQRNYTA